MTNEARTVTAVVTFGASPIVPTAVNPGEPVNKSQLDLAVLGTVPASSTTVLGAVRVATDPTKTLGTATMTIASPCVVTFNSHALTVNDTIKFTTTGALPTGLVVGTTYYVISTGLTANTFQLALTAGGTAINTSGLQSGTHTLYRTTPYSVNDRDYRFGTNSFGIDSGTANAHVVTLPANQPTALVSGNKFSYIVNVTNTTSVTTNIASTGVKTIKKLNGTTDLVAGDLVAGQIIEIEYNATSGFFMLMSPIATAPTIPSTLSSSFLAGETLSVNDPVVAHFGQSDGGILYDTKVSVASTISSAGGTITLPITIASNSNRALVVFVKAIATGSGNVAPAPLFDGGAMTVGNSNLSDAYNGAGSGSFYLLNPGSGTKNITWALPPSSGATIGYLITAYSFYNVYQSGVDGTQYGASPQSYTITNLASLVVSCAMNNGGAPTGGSNMQNNQQSGSAGGVGFLSGDGGLVAPIQSNSYSATGAGQMYLISLRPVTTASLGYVKKTSASSTTNGNNANLYNSFMGFVSAIAGGGVFGTAVTVIHDGIVTGLSGLIPFTTYYLSNTSGIISTTAGTNSKKIGVALTTTTLLIKHDN
jgi:hypothetical protein